MTNTASVEDFAGSRSAGNPALKAQGTWQVHRPGLPGLATVGQGLLNALGFTSADCFVFQVRGGVPQRLTWYRSRTDRLPRPTAVDLADWQSFLATVERDFGRTISSATESFWAMLTKELGAPPVPVAVVGPEGGLELVWDTGVRRLDFEILPEGGVHWFYRDRKSGECAGTDEDPVPDLPKNFPAMLRELL